MINTNYSKAMINGRERDSEQKTSRGRAPATWWIRIKTFISEEELFGPTTQDRLSKRRTSHKEEKNDKEEEVGMILS